MGCQSIICISLIEINKDRRDLNAKMGKRIKNAKAKHGLTPKMGFKTKFGLNLGEENRGEEGKKKKEEEEAKLRYGN